jgi:hypothetical protein
MPIPVGHDRWLSAARLVWLVIVALAIGMFVVGVPLRFAELQQPCTDLPAACSNRLLPTGAELVQLTKDGLGPPAYALVLTGFAMLNTLAYFGIALLIFVRQSNHWGALIISLALILFGTSNALWEALAQTFPVFQPLVRFLFFLGLCGFMLIFATFPNGRVVPRAMWVVLALWGLYALLDSLSTYAATQVVVSDALANIAWPMMFLSGIAAQLYRYKRVSTTVEREQTKWVVLGLAALVIFVLLTFVVFAPDASYFQGASMHRLSFQILTISVAFLLIPVPIAISILRYRLWDIDVIIRKTLVYTVLTALLALIYFGGVVLVQQLTRSITGGSSDVAIVISTLLIAALFFPLRRRVQNAIDRRFYRRKYDAAKTLAAFGVTVRDEVELDKLTAELLNVVQDTMQPASVSLWLKPTRYAHAIPSKADHNE